MSFLRSLVFLKHSLRGKKLSREEDKILDSFWKNFKNKQIDPAILEEDVAKLNEQQQKIVDHHNSWNADIERYYGSDHEPGFLRKVKDLFS